MRKNASEGQCALTGTTGKFVKSHILPQAFTRPVVKGLPLYQSTRGKGETRRWSSWYDSKLVVREGEDLLSHIDDTAIKVLRKHQLVWSGWTVFRPHFETMGPLFPDHGLRRIKGVDSEALMRFALSVAWRASASSLPDMKDATVDPELQEQLKEFVLGKQIKGPSDFPISLTQLSSRGEAHNHAPFVDQKRVFDPEGESDEFQKIMRIYVDGLVLHVHLSPIEAEHLHDNPLYLGSSNEVYVTAVTYQASFQYENMLHLMRECHPSLIERG